MIVIVSVDFTFNSRVRFASISTLSVAVEFKVEDYTLTLLTRSKTFPCVHVQRYGVQFWLDLACGCAPLRLHVETQNAQKNNDQYYH